MNEIIYKLLSKTNKKEPLNEDLLKKLYQEYDNGSKIFEYDKNISKDDFRRIFSTINDILRLRLNNEETKNAIYNYLYLLIADAKDGFNVDINWCIKYVWYLCTETDNTSQKYKDCISFIQQKLIKEFNIKETVKEKVKRKIYTSYMSNI